jgi:hypothetical protein
MAGTLAADNLQNGAGVSTSMDNAIYGSAKAWVNFNGASGVIRGSYNVSSVTRTGTGLYTVTYTNAFTNTNYSTVIGQGSSGARGESMCVLTMTTTNSTYSNGIDASYYDTSFGCVAVFSS